MKTRKRLAIALVTLLCVFGSYPVQAATGSHAFSFKFTDLKNHDYPATWIKENTNKSYSITLNRHNRLIPNTMSSENIFGCKMKDLSIAPAADVYHTFSKYVSNYSITYQTTVHKNDRMQLAGKKDNKSSSGANLRISGTIVP